MNSRRTLDFHKCFSKLPEATQRLARKNYKLWKADPSHPSLDFKCVNPKEQTYSVRIGLHWRVLGTKDNDTMIWFWIGPHAEYDQLLRTYGK